jgi:anthranilate phosphoribosyltransferase
VTTLPTLDDDRDASLTDRLIVREPASQPNPAAALGSWWPRPAERLDHAMTFTHADALAAIVRQEGLAAPEVSQLLELLLSGTITPEAGAQLLTAWTARGETATELATVVHLLLTHAVQVPLSGPCFDLCGTGGSELTRYNVSTTVAFVLAAAGVPVAKHGNRGSKRPNGSFDLLDALGVPFALPPKHLATLFLETGVCFLFARSMHPAVAKIAPMRKLVAGRTIFNLAGPLANPCKPARQVVGVVKDATAQVVAGALQHLHVERAIVVKGHPGLDEVSITGPSHLWEVAHGRTHHRIVEHFHQHGLDHAALPGGDADVNASLFADLLQGRQVGPLLDMVIANAALALDCWRNSAHPGGQEAIAVVREIIASGLAWNKYQCHKRLAEKLAVEA